MQTIIISHITMGTNMVTQVQFTFILTNPPFDRVSDTRRLFRTIFLKQKCLPWFTRSSSISKYAVRLRIYVRASMGKLLIHIYIYRRLCVRFRKSCNWKPSFENYIYIRIITERLSKYKLLNRRFEEHWWLSQIGWLEAVREISRKSTSSNIQIKRVL